MELRTTWHVTESAHVMCGRLKVPSLELVAIYLTNNFDTTCILKLITSGGMLLVYWRRRRSQQFYRVAICSPLQNLIEQRNYGKIPLCQASFDSSD